MNTYLIHNYAKIAQLVERNLAKVEVASSNLVFRSTSRISLVDPGYQNDKAIVPVSVC